MKFVQRVVEVLAYSALPAVKSFLLCGFGVFIFLSLLTLWLALCGHGSLDDIPMAEREYLFTSVLKLSLVVALVYAITMGGSAACEILDARELSLDDKQNASAGGQG